MNSFNPKALSLPKTATASVQKQEPDGGLPTRIEGDRFLKGPVPWSWLSRAAKLPGKALHVATVVWHLAGMAKGITIRLSQKRLRELGVERNAAYRGLAELEKEGLVSVERRRGRNSKVTIILK